MSENPFLQQPTEKKTPLYLRILQFVAIVFSLGLVAYMFLIDFNEVDGPSMLPNYRTNNLVVVGKFYNLLDFNYERNDVVVFNGENDVLVKRVVGMPGERIQMRNGLFYINGNLYSPNIQVIADNLFNDEFLINNGEVITLANDEYFLVGDNRLDSVDSRDFGPVRKEDIKGKVLVSL